MKYWIIGLGIFVILLVMTAFLTIILSDELPEVPEEQDFATVLFNKNQFNCVELRYAALKEYTDCTQCKKASDGYYWTGCN